ncbi:hypothetical protein GcC1_169011 [Golovinomyces cichoracearum]|uniref:Uncharacterized protein n=1 Tax=Golovinomyces cichoracearum TaxID=62708 RepID=A0A420HRX2_9PEZI|nr:hypothetical protein GcC1_169011 [Golovinomyces cichoracearum]
MSAQYKRIRSYILAASVAAVTIVGTVSGAKMKMQSQAEKKAEKLHKASPIETIRLLEQQRIALVQKECAIEKKINAHKARVAKSAEIGSKRDRES